MKMELKNLIVMLIFLLVVASIASAGEIIYVDNDASVGGDGLSWSTAFKYLQDGLAAASYGDEIRVAQGSYKPDLDEAGSVTPGNREETFQLINGVVLKGGYAGAGEPEPNERDVEAYETILSGDLNGDDVGFTNNGENSLHVTVGSETDPNTILDGLTIVAGNANNGPGSHGYGGGMYSKNGDMTLINCTFAGNMSSNFGNRGGGMYTENGNMTLTGCTFIGNSAGVCGGGMHIYSADPILTNCTFISNSAGYQGGGMYNEYYCSPTLINCTFIGNSAGYNGGGMRNAGTGPIVTNCTFIGNSAGRGGGIDDYTAGYQVNMMLTNSTFIGNEASLRGGGLCYGHCSPTVANCTFVDNSAGEYGGGICGEFEAWPDHAVVVNCILWANNAGEGPQIALLTLDKMAVSYCCLQGGLLDIYVEDNPELIWDANSNIDDAPCFADADNDDYHLQSQAGRWDAAGENWLTDDVNSPCIDAGDPNSDWTAELWPHGKRINMGAVGGMPQASMSESPAGNIADLDANDVVNYADLKLFTERWLQQHVLLSEDLDRDGSVNFKDFAIFADNWSWEQ